MAGKTLIDKKKIMLEHPKAFIEYKESLIKQMKQVISILEHHHVTWWITGGTLLGLYRDGDIIFPDYDTDIAIAAETMNVECIKELEAFSIVSGNHIVDDKYRYLENPQYLLKGFKMNAFTPDRNWKFKGGKPTMFGSLKMIPSVDIFPYKLLDGKRWKRVYPERMRWHLDETLLPVKKFKTKYGVFNIPNNPEEYCRMTYGDDWQTPITMLDMHRAAEYENRCTRKESGDIRINYVTKEVKSFPFPNDYENQFI